MNRPCEGVNLAEAGGFEPPVREKAHGSLANCWFQPLTQTSKVGKQLTAFSKCGAKVILLFCSTKLLPNFFCRYPILGKIKDDDVGAARRGRSNPLEGNVSIIAVIKYALTRL